MQGIRKERIKRCKRIEAAAQQGPYQGLHDVVRRLPLDRDPLANLAAVGAFGSFGMTRREAIWAVGVIAAAEDLLPDAPLDIPALLPLTDEEAVRLDYALIGCAPGGRHLMAFYRPLMDEWGVVTAKELDSAPHGRAVKVGQWFVEIVSGIPAHRQVVASLFHQLALGANTFEKHHQLELEEDDGIDGRTTAAGVAIGGEIADKRKIKDAMKVPIEVILRHIGFDRDEDGTVEVAGLGRTEHGAPPCSIDNRMMLPPKSRDFQQAVVFCALRSPPLSVGLPFWGMFAQICLLVLGSSLTTVVAGPMIVVRH